MKCPSTEWGELKRTGGDKFIRLGHLTVKYRLNRTFHTSDIGLSNAGDLIGEIANETEPKPQVFIVIWAKSGTKRIKFFNQW